MVDEDEEAEKGSLISDVERIERDEETKRERT